MTPALVTDVTFTHFHLFCGLGGGARGFNRGSARVGNLRARFRCLGGVDVDPAGLRDFGRLAGAPGTLLDLFDLEQYRAFHGRDPATGWQEAVPADILRAAGGEHPDIVFLSAPCKGFSGLLPESSSASAKYQALNRLTLRGVWLMLEAFKGRLPRLVIFENVPRIMTRGRKLLDRIVALLRSYGYAVAETVHDCGEVGGLAQSRKRFLLVARHQESVPPFLYEPEKRRLLGVGEILERLPLPGDPRGGPMHRIPSLQWRTWVRLAFVDAGSDWRSLNRLAVEGGMLRDYKIAPDAGFHNGALGVRRWDEPSGVVAGGSRPMNGAYSVADPRPPEGSLEYSQYGVRPWGEPSGAVINVKSPGQGVFSVADPRMEGRPRFNNVFRIVEWDKTAPAVAGPGGPGGGLAVADPRAIPRDDYKQTKYRVTGYGEPAGTVIAASTTGNGAFAVADPRTGYGPDSHRNKLKVVGYGGAAGTVTGSDRVGSGALSVADPRPVGLNASREHYVTGGHYGVLRWDETSGAVPAFGKYDRGRWSVADPRGGTADVAERLPEPADRLVAVIRSLDGTWHRPFTTLELAALQSLVDIDEIGEGLVFDGQSDSAWRERIGNAVPPDAATAIAGVMGTTLLLAMTGHTFMLSSLPIWVRPVATALAVDQGNAAAGEMLT